MTGKLRPRGGPMNTGAAADCVVLPNRHRAVAPASVVDSIERRYSGAVTVARHISQREAVGENAADHTFTNFTDSARCVSLWRLSSPHTLGKPRRILTSHIRSATASWARVRCDRRQPVPKVDVTMGMYRGARTY
jgi:hypothetical protein